MLNPTSSMASMASRCLLQRSHIAIRAFVDLQAVAPFVLPGAPHHAAALVTELSRLCICIPNAGPVPGGLHHVHLKEIGEKLRSKIGMESKEFT